MITQVTCRPGDYGTSCPRHKSPPGNPIYIIYIGVPPRCTGPMMDTYGGGVWETPPSSSLPHPGGHRRADTREPEGAWLPARQKEHRR